MDYAVWNTLHDGSIEAIEGAVPGKVRLTVGIIYLCKKLPTSATHLIVDLHGCTRFEFEPYDHEALSDLAQIAKRELEILSAHPGPDFIEVTCTGGALFLAYERVERRLKEGKLISQEALEEAAKRYWTEWEEKNRQC